MAVVVGGPPAFVMAACARLSHSRDKHAVAGGLQEAPLELVPCQTVDLMVPANAEIIIEGFVRAGERRPEGPFGEFTGCYGRETISPVFHATCVTMRRDAIYQDFLTGFPISEDQALMYLPRCAAVYQSATAVHPDVRAVHWQVDTGNVYGVVVSIRKRVEAEPWNVIASVLAGPALVKQCIVVDEDIDVFDAEAVQWALSTRVQPHRDVHIFPTMVGAPLDPSSPDVRSSSKIGYDATIPLADDRARYERVRVPGEDTASW
jgi:2,5-furandicarboxylate decarboxylase 1